jgi:hypothetical protein
VHKIADPKFAARSLSDRQAQATDPYRARLIRAQAIADRHAARLVASMALGLDALAGDLDDRWDVLAELCQVLNPPRSDETDDERHGADLAATEDAAFLLGVAIGRRLPKAGA